MRISEFSWIILKAKKKVEAFFIIIILKWFIINIKQVRSLLSKFKVYLSCGVFAATIFDTKTFVTCRRRRVCRFFSCFSTGTRGVCAICFCCHCCCWAYPTVLTANWFTRVCFYGFPLQIETQTRTHTHTNTHRARGKADNENEARKQWWRWTTGPEAQQTQRGDRSHTDTEQCKYWMAPPPVNPILNPA